MKKLLKVLFVLMLALTCTVGQCNHVHDDECGYDPETGEGCTHTCDVVSPLADKDPHE